MTWLHLKKWTYSSAVQMYRLSILSLLKIRHFFSLKYLERDRKRHHTQKEKKFSSAEGLKTKAYKENTYNAIIY